MLEEEIKEISELGIEHIMLFGVPDEKMSVLHKLLMIME